MIYTLPQIVINETTPPWAKNVIASMQAEIDSEYETAVDAYYSAAQQWIDSNTLTRSLVADPAHYTPSAFMRDVPTRRQVTGWDQAAQQYVSAPFTDPNIHPPVLSPFVRPAGATTGQIRETDPGPDPVQSALGTILSDLAKIKAAMKIS